VNDGTGPREGPQEGREMSELLVTCCVCGEDVPQENARVVATDHGPDSVCDDCEYVADQD
jgi:hypothetical protein